MSLDDKEKKIMLSEKEMPRQWYNINPDLPRPLDPPLHPQTGKRSWEVWIYIIPLPRHFLF